ncbi:GNAT family N-acetyltransferase [Chromobacterium phragmitis]|uniref:GNAT family N-acetyltransferase n=1 Tax=Chromobacterium phragmitis TaxID=2202141 RepID=A0A344UIM6_9NEIS|nr:GNAT family N-acetyltransferase [Chromobacterium phragmitis]AXE35124.1 GNAT family N-acetyltransferase [Chromobacterium phragmitis]
MLTLRPAAEADIPVIAALHAGSWRASYRGILPDDYLDRRADDDRLAIWRGRFASPARLWLRIACWNGEPVGFVCLLPDEAPELGVYLDNLHVRADQQGRGIGRALMAAAAAEACRAAPGRPLYLWVYERNADACAVYARLGGEEAERQEVDTPAGTRAVALRFSWPDPARLLPAGI